MKKLLAVLMLLTLAACGTKQAAPPGVKIGKPYSIGWTTYYPEYDPTYDKTGIASWYGPGFHGKSTATGETYDQHDLTAAHPTLPMPSLVRVTNLDNGKSAVVRINDRGPFKSGRIIDLSKASAKRLGVTSLAKVRVQYLKTESEQYIAALQEGRQIDLVAYNDQQEKQKYASILESTEPSENAQIVEATNTTSKPGDIIASAAPTLSVESSNIKGSKPSFGIIREAWAEDNPHNDPPTKSASKEVVLKPMNELTEPIDKPSDTTISGGYFVQAGSFSTEENAQKLKSKLATVPFIDIGKVEMNGKVWWRVRAGAFADEAEAKNALAKVQELGVADARIIHQ